jgi:1-acyl-sn-glycerol-3-phosphate acyltransferase
MNRLNTLCFAQVNYAWRLVLTGACFALFGLGGLLMGLVWFNALFLIQRDKNKRRVLARRTISASFRLFLNTASKVGVLSYHIDGRALLNAEKGVLIVANHPTLLDYVLIASVMPDVDCLVKAGLLRNPFVRNAILSADYLINSQADILLPASQARLARGDNILIFPEGTRTDNSEQLVLQRGAANIAVRCHCDLRVVHITCSQATLAKHQKWFQIPPQKPVFCITVRERIDSATFAAYADETESIQARRLTQKMAVALKPIKEPLTESHYGTVIPRH